MDFYTMSGPRSTNGIYSIACYTVACHLVQTSGQHNPTAIECKWKSANFDQKNLMVFRKHYPGEKNYVVSPDIDRDYQRDYNGHTVSFVSLDSLIVHLSVDNRNIS